MVWADAVWEPQQTNKSVVAFVVCFPPGHLGPDEVWLYGAENTPQEILDKFDPKRRNCIGQLELLAAILVRTRRCERSAKGGGHVRSAAREQNACAQRRAVSTCSIQSAMRVLVGAPLSL